MSNKEIAVEFLTLIVQGDIDQAFDKFVDPNGKHHNIYFPAAFWELKKGMLHSHQMYPNKHLEIIQAIEEENKVAILSKISIDDKIFSISYFFIFESDRIKEMWDFSQEIPKNTINENGAF